MNNQSERKDFTFEISLSVLNHLGRNLYRSFATVLGEAISNSWDANAENVQLYIDREKNHFFIKDDGDGMTSEDFQHKFLKIGYSKRNERNSSPGKERPYIGRKGIGKLALLSCAERIMIISKKQGEEYIGGSIDNSGLDEAIQDDLATSEYKLGNWNPNIFERYTKNHEKGTIIYFEGINEGIKHTPNFFRKSIALYFRFSLLDKEFKIYINDEEITINCLHDLISNTEFLWEINDIQDPYIQLLKESFKSEDNEEKELDTNKDVIGFIASVKKPRNLKILSTDERVGVDLFVNGRLRERDILKHIPTTRIVESYLYGQIHFNDLDDEEDRFSSSREGIRAGDPKYQVLLNLLKDDVIPMILNDWDDWRRKHKKKGDSENPSIAPKERVAEELYNEVSKGYELPENSDNKKIVSSWIDDLSIDARFNFPSYAECFISENLIRNFIQKQEIDLTEEAKRDILHYQKKEMTSKDKGNISIPIRKDNAELSYLDMDGLANLVDKGDQNKEACLSRDANEYKPIRDALAHTSLLTDNAKLKLTSIFENIKGRIRTLLSG